ncbi:hypothetical protein HN706_00730 [Candidatus Woesearchaeota archaeon]|jgi:hypothetical protein|nr:hypothetical protein [Candidatus Woesearchaeota archaeon]MBT6735195.1 hypothetical protein [Candidatus Woesearchaeota archaeon]MBT7169794.1 hypothetical protein [Candidatus Woesearchaeota archaeon]MBT7474451.1 hypothetical protein [Candidatus Woesearchaeota archaeon]
MFFKKKNKLKFTLIKEAIDENLKNRKFTMALALYSKLQEEYLNLGNELRHIHYEDYQITQNKLILLMKVQELIRVTKTDDIEAINKKLTDVNDYLFHKIGEIPERFYSYLQHNYSQAYKVYEHKIHKAELSLLLETIKTMIREQNYDRALSIFPEVMKIFNKTIAFKRNDELAKELSDLKAHLKMSLLKQHAYSEVSKVDEKTIKKLLRKKIKKVIEKKEKPIKKLPEDPENKDIQDLKKLIKKNKIDDSTIQFEKVFNSKVL